MAICESVKCLVDSLMPTVAPVVFVSTVEQFDVTEVLYDDVDDKLVLEKSVELESPLVDHVVL